MLSEFQKLKALAKSSWGFWIALFLSTAEAGYTFIVFWKTSKLPDPFGLVQALIIAVMMDMAVLYFTVKGEKKLSAFYWVAMTGYVVLSEFIGVVEAKYVILGWKALTLPAAIYFFSHTMTLTMTVQGKDGKKKAVSMKADSDEVDDEKVEKKQTIFTLKKQGLSTRDIALQVGLHYTYVNKIIAGKAWQTVKI